MLVFLSPITIFIYYLWGMAQLYIVLCLFCRIFPSSHHRTRLEFPGFSPWRACFSGLIRVNYKYFQGPNTFTYFNISWFFQIAYFFICHVISTPMYKSMYFFNKFNHTTNIWDFRDLPFPAIISLLVFLQMSIGRR